MTSQTLFLAPDGAYLASAAQAVLDFARAEGATDLLGCSVLVPNLKLAPALMAQFGAVSCGHLLLPRIETLSGMVEPWLRETEFLPDSRRQLILHAVLRSRHWFDDAVLWDVVGELVAFFDTLTDHAVTLPASETELLDRLETAFGLRNAAPLAFEARLVHTLWHAEAQGKPSRRAAQLLVARKWIASLRGPLAILQEDDTDPVVREIAQQASVHVPVLRIIPDRSLSAGVLPHLLNSAWPLASDVEQAPLIERAAQLSLTEAQESRSGLTLCEAGSMEDLAVFACGQVLQWLEEGRREIALVAADRIVARRARALLERHGVLVADETGWKFSTTRAAATVDALLEVLATDAYHRALIDLLRSPFLFADQPVGKRALWVSEIERVVLETQITSGLDRIRAAVAEKSEEAASLLDRLVAMRRSFSPRQEASISDWLNRLLQALEILGARTAMEEDAAGHEWLDWLVQRRDELNADGEVFPFAAWRSWFNREMDNAMFRDASIDSPVIMTHLAATRLRAFEAAIVIGANSEHLVPSKAPAWLTHAGVRRELGLPGLDRDKLRIREDLAGLVLACGKTVICWQSAQREEVLMPAPDVDVLARVWTQACGGNVVLRAEQVPAGSMQDLPKDTRSHPSVPPERMPVKVSASALKTLFDCPYRYFARYVLRLKETEELTEGLEKRDFGTCVHAILQQFHTEWPTLAEHDDATLVAALTEITEAHFAPWVARSFLDQAWRIRWSGRLGSYIDWQRQRESEGWTVRDHEVSLNRELRLSDDSGLTLQGRVDRRDQRAEEFAVLDYKARSTMVLRKQTKDADDVQLAFYALLHEEAPSVAAYVALDDVVAAAPLEDLGGMAEKVLSRLDAAFIAMKAGEGMPAHGIESVCGRCEMAGLCREEWLR